MNFLSVKMCKNIITVYIRLSFNCQEYLCHAALEVLRVYYLKRIEHYQGNGENAGYRAVFKRKVVTRVVRLNVEQKTF